MMTLVITYDVETNTDEVSLIVSNPKDENKTLTIKIKVPNQQGRQWVHKNFPGQGYAYVKPEPTEVTSVEV